MIATVLSYKVLKYFQHNNLKYSWNNILSVYFKKSNTVIILRKDLLKINTLKFVKMSLFANEVNMLLYQQINAKGVWLCS